MKRTHPAFWGAGWAGLFTGVLLMVIGGTAPADIGSLTVGYGTMLIGSALFLLAGLRLRTRFARRPAVSVSSRIPAASRS
ncbi:MAG TPA: hypothetical protein VHU77_06940 [Candidatus Limnocylindria bacterium]|jgi:hypothetical protein|nr:hypothetical protein [Candidatus Limnocylindria bacterium]